MPQQPRARVTEANAPYSNTPYADKLCGRSNISSNLQAQLDGLTNALKAEREKYLKDRIAPTS